jgi:hypothetical protein
MIEVCALRGYGTNVNGKVIRCSSTMHDHHIWNKSKYPKSKKVKAYIKKHPEVFIARVCSVHNVDRWADQPAARRKMVRQKNELLGSDYVRDTWNAMPYDVFPHEFKWEAVMVAPLPK